MFLRIGIQKLGSDHQFCGWHDIAFGCFSGKFDVFGFTATRDTEKAEPECQVV